MEPPFNYKKQLIRSACLGFIIVGFWFFLRYLDSVSLTVSYSIWSGWDMSESEESRRIFKVHRGFKINIQTLSGLELKGEVVSVQKDSIVIRTAFPMVPADSTESNQNLTDLHTINRGEKLVLRTPSYDVVVTYSFYFE